MSGDSMSIMRFVYAMKMNYLQILPLCYSLEHFR